MVRLLAKWIGQVCVEFKKWGNLYKNYLAFFVGFYKKSFLINA